MSLYDTPGGGLHGWIAWHWYSPGRRAQVVRIWSSADDEDVLGKGCCCCCGVDCEDCDEEDVDVKLKFLEVGNEGERCVRGRDADADAEESFPLRFVLGFREDRPRAGSSS